METPHSMLLSLVQTGEVVYTVPVGQQTRSGGLIYVAQEGVNMP